MAENSKVHTKAVVGDISTDYWIYDSETGFDLTRPWPETSGPKENAIALQTTSTNITIDPEKSALIIIDMQNMFLSPALGRPTDSKGLKAQKSILKYALPAARKAGIQVVWLNWGLEKDDLASMSPADHRAFGFVEVPACQFQEHFLSSKPASSYKNVGVEHPVSDLLGKDTRIYKGLGADLGDIELNGSKISAGRLLMRDQWNTRLSPGLEESYQASKNLDKPDAWVHKIRMSGFHTPSTDANIYCKENGIKTLFFAGVNTDQCVGGSLMDASAQGYDCILLSDGCATTSPQAAQQCWEYNSSRSYGFLMSCADLSEGVDRSFNATK